jgi:hypothetical protein
MKSDSSLDVLWELEVRLTETATAMERDATAKSISGPAAERLTQKAEGLRLARAYVWDAIRARRDGNGANGANE